jgi:SAM-dependent methyltransferase
MRDNVKHFVELVVRALDLPEPVVEIGSLQTPGQEGYADLRGLFAGKAYRGCDVVAGPGVDQMEDIHRLSFADLSVGTLIVVETLEHVRNPYRAVAELHRVLRPDGFAVITTPFHFPVHHMPDYTRFTPEGVAQLLGVFAARAVFAEGDAQSPHTVYAVASKRTGDTDRVAFEAAMGRIQNDWYLRGTFDPLMRFAPLVSVARCERQDRALGALVAGRRIEQEFVCERDGLARIDLRLGLTGPKSHGELFLRVGADGSELVTVPLRAPQVYQERWLAFCFPPLPSSGGRRLTLRLESTDPQCTVTAFASEDAAIADGRLIVDGVEQAGTLCFEAFCQRSEPALVWAAEDRETASFKPRDLGAEPAAVAAARLQAAELHHAVTELREAIEQLRGDVVVQARHLADELVKAEVRQQAQAGQLVKMELRQQADHEVLERAMAAVGEVRSFVAAMRDNRLMRLLARLLGRARES